MFAAVSTDSSSSRRRSGCSEFVVLVYKYRKGCSEFGMLMYKHPHTETSKVIRVEKLRGSWPSTAVQQRALVWASLNL